MLIKGNNKIEIRNGELYLMNNGNEQLLPYSSVLKVKVKMNMLKVESTPNRASTSIFGKKYYLFLIDIFFNDYSELSGIYKIENKIDIANILTLLKKHSNMSEIKSKSMYFELYNYAEAPNFSLQRFEVFQHFEKVINGYEGIHLLNEKDTGVKVDFYLLNDYFLVLHALVQENRKRILKSIFKKTTKYFIINFLILFLLLIIKRFEFLNESTVSIFFGGILFLQFLFLQIDFVRREKDFFYYVFLSKKDIFQSLFLNITTNILFVLTYSFFSKEIYQLPVIYICSALVIVMFFIIKILLLDFISENDKNELRDKISDADQIDALLMGGNLIVSFVASVVCLFLTFI